MSFKPIDEMYKVGVMTDIDPYSLPPNVVEYSTNIDFRGDVALQALGYTDTLGGDLLDPPLVLIPINDAGIDLLFGLTESKAHRYTYSGVDGWEITDITRTTSAYSAAIGTWSWVYHKGVFYINSSFDLPQSKVSTGSSSQFIDLPNWPSTNKAEFFRSFRDVLVALNTTESGVNFPYRLRWSSPTSGGAVPTSWDETNPTLKAGYFDVDDAPGLIIDAQTLANSFLIYKDSGVVRMNFVGGQSQYAKELVSKEADALTKYSVVTVGTLKSHAVMGSGDIYLTDGYTIKSIASGRVKRNIFSTLSSSGKLGAHTVHNEKDQEVWFCYGTTNSSAADTAWIWNYQYDTWQKRVLNENHHAAFGLLALNISDVEELLFATPANGGVQIIGATTQSCVIGRTGLFYGPSVRTLTAMHIGGEEITGAQVTFKIGSVMQRGETVVWGKTYTGPLTGTLKVDAEVTGRAFAWEISSPAAARLKLTSLAFEFNDAFESLT